MSLKDNQFNYEKQNNLYYPIMTK